VYASSRFEHDRCIAPLTSRSSIKIRATIGSNMRAFFAILGLLVCLFETRADQFAGEQRLRSDSVRGQKGRGARFRCLRQD